MKFARIALALLMAASFCWLPCYASTGIKTLLKQAESLRSSDPKAFKQLLDELNTRAEFADANERQQLAYLNAYAEAYAGRYDLAVADATRLIDATADVNLQFRASALIVNSYAATRQFTEGLRQLERTLSLMQNIKDPELRQHGLIVAALLYNQIGRYELGEHYAEQIEPTAPERTLCFAGQLLLEAQVNLQTRFFDDSPFFKVIDRCTVQHEAIMANLVRSLLARRWTAQGKRKQSIAFLREHLTEVEATRFPRLIGEIHSQLSEILIAEGEYPAAERHARAAITHSSGMINSLPLATAYKSMYEISLKRGDTAAALDYYRKYAGADKAYLNDIKAREFAYQLVRHETLRKNQQIALLDRKNQVLELQQRIEKQSRQNTQLLVALMTVLLATIGYWAYKIKRMQMSFRRLAETDTLTGISNRHHFTRQAEEALTYCARTGEDVGLIMFDLDHFKSINDRFGHEVGDFVLTRVAQKCKSRCRKNDRFGRIGGEEFAILLIGCDLETTTRMAQACCAHIAEIDTSETGHSFPVTASFGVTTASLSGYELTRMLSNADQMLYCSKHDGRNRVSVFTAAMKPERVAGEQFA